MFAVMAVVLLGIIGEAIVIGKMINHEKRAEKAEAMKRRNWNNAWI